MIKLLTWNIRGVGNIATVRRLKKLCSLHGFSIIILLEPFVAADQIKSLSTKLGFQDCLASENNKIWILWRHNLTVQLLSQTDQLVNLRCCHPLLPRQIFISAVYAKCSMSRYFS